MTTAAHEVSYDDLYENAPCGYFTTSPAGTIVTVNDTFLTMGSFRREDVLGSTFESLLTAQSALYLQTQYQQTLLLDGSVNDVALTLQRPDGSTVPVSVTTMLSRTDDGAVRWMRTAVIDGTKRAHHARELLDARRASERAELHIRVLEGASVILNSAESEEALATTVSAIVREALGCYAVSLLFVDNDTVRVTDGSFPAHPIPLQALLPSAPQAGAIATVPLEHVMIHDRSWARSLTSSRIHTITAAPCLDGEAVVAVIACFHRRSRDVDADEQTMLTTVARYAAQALARVRLQAKLRHAASDADRLRQLMESVVDTLDVGVLVTDPAGEPMLINRVMRESPALATSLDPWESLKTARAFQEDRVTPIPPEDSTLARVMRGERVTQQLEWMGLPTGPQSAYSVSGRAVHTTDGEHLANVLVYSNVTNLMTAIEARDAFIGTVSHELRTPLTTVSGFLELLLEREDRLEPEVVEWLKVMERNVQRQHVLVRDLLTTAGARSAPIALEIVRADLAGVAREAAAAVRKESSAKNMQLRVKGAAAVGNFDPIRMAQVAENLMTNAVRYSPEGTRVDVAVAAEEGELTMRVKDRGGGIAPDDQALLFEPFFRSSEARATATRGVGLGLPIVKAIVDAHGGAIDVTSALGAGTTITVRLPRD